MSIQSATPARSSSEVLASCRRLFDPALRAAVDELPESMRRVAGYQLGWWDEAYRPTATGGKAIRPALVVLMAAAVGGAPTTALPASVAVELVHNFTIVHDDVIDGDDMRRHRPAAWAVFGRNAAILAGTSLLSLAFDVLAASDHSAAQQGSRVLAGAVQTVLDGQSLDLAFEHQRDVDMLECFSMAMAKTGALMGCACGLGALFGGAGPELVAHARTFGERLGLAFQLVDDMLGIWGDPALTGKPVYGDLGRRKKSLPVVAALTSGTPAGIELSVLYHGDQPLSGNDLVRAAELIDLAGGRAWSLAQADDLLDECLRLLESSDLAAPVAAELRELARLIIWRAA